MNCNSRMIDPAWSGTRGTAGPRRGTARTSKGLFPIWLSRSADTLPEPTVAWVLAIPPALTVIISAVWNVVDERRT